MAMHEIKEGEWKNYFDSLSKKLSGLPADVAVAGSDFGDQIGERDVVIEGISFDPRAKTIFIHTSGLNHSVRDPKEIVASETEDKEQIQAISIKDAAGSIHAITFTGQRPQAIH